MLNDAEWLLIKQEPHNRLVLFIYWSFLLLQISLTRDAIPPVSDGAGSLYNSVKDTVTDQVLPAVEPYAYRFGKTLQNDVGPSIQSAVKTSLNAVFTGVPEVINQVSTWTSISL